MASHPMRSSKRLRSTRSVGQRDTLRGWFNTWHALRSEIWNVS
jgi:hypothetical protein